jgi:hypothetical protein
VTTAATVRCRACPAQVRWVVMARSGKRAPINPEPDAEKGNVMLIADAADEAIFKAEIGQALVLAGEALEEERANGTDLYLSHFATCPGAEGLRKR